MRRIDRLALPVAMLLLLIGSVRGDDDAAKAKLQELQAGYQAEMNALGAKFRAAEDDEAKQAIINEELPALREKFTNEFMALAEANEGKSVAAAALGSAYTVTADGEVQKEIQNTLKEKYINTDGMAEAVMIFQRDEEFIDHLLEVSMNRNVLGIASYIKMMSAKGRELNEDNEATVIPMMEEIVEKYGDVKLIFPGGREMGTLGDSIDNELFAYRNLRIGKEAPDIEGEDIDGVEFKLSDYRGKVVVIDFWGDW